MNTGLSVPCTCSGSIIAALASGPSACAACCKGRRPPQLWRYTGPPRRASRHVDAFIAPSRFTRAMHAERGFARPMEHLPHFIDRADDDWRRPSPRPHGRPYFLFVGRLEAIKGLQTVIPLMAQVPEADLLVAGTGSYENELRALAAANPRIKFLGSQSQRALGPLYHHAIACVIPSLVYETFGMITLEAFARRTPVLARDIGPLPEVVRESGGGILFRDDAEWIEGARRLAGDLPLRNELGNRGYDAFLARWTREAHLEQYVDLITRTALVKFGSIPWSPAPAARAAGDGGGPRVNGATLGSWLSDRARPDVSFHLRRARADVHCACGFPAADGHAGRGGFSGRVARRPPLLDAKRSRAAGTVRCLDLRRRLRRLCRGGLPRAVQRGWPATVFVPTGYVGDCDRWEAPLDRARPRALLDWSTIAELSAGGVDFGGHGVWHRDVTRLRGAALEEEVAGTKRAIEQKTGREVTSFAAPYGYSNREVQAMVRRHYSLAVSTTLAVAGRESDPYDVPRIEMWYFRGPRRFTAFLQGGARTFLATRRLVRRSASRCRAASRTGRNRWRVPHEFLVPSGSTCADHLEELPRRALAAVSHLLHQLDLQPEMRALLLLAQSQPQGRPHARGNRRAVALAGPDREPRTCRGASRSCGRSFPRFAGSSSGTTGCARFTCPPTARSPSGRSGT